MQYHCAACGKLITRHIKPTVALRHKHLYCDLHCAAKGATKLLPIQQYIYICDCCGYTSTTNSICPKCTLVNLLPLSTFNDLYYF